LSTFDKTKSVEAFVTIVNTTTAKTQWSTHRRRWWNQEFLKVLSDEAQGWPENGHLPSKTITTTTTTRYQVDMPLDHLQRQQPPEQTLAPPIGKNELDLHLPHRKIR
jgi:hypothetical protein